MESSAYAIGQAVFIRTDTVDFREETIPFANLDELAVICSTPRPNLMLEKVIIFSMQNAQPSALTLGFIASTKGQKAVPVEIAEEK